MASDSMEFAGIPHTQPADYPVDWVRSANWGAHQALLVANGVGRARAAAAVDAAAAFRPDAICSTGFCGALDPELGIAQIVAGTEITASGGRYPAQSVPGGRQGLICSLDHVAQTAGEKRLLSASGACAVEMEAAGVAVRARELDVPFYCIRAVTDLADESLSNDFNAALRSDGHFDTIKILRGALRHPTVRFPELLRLRSRCVRAARGLGEFIVDCRF